MSQTIIVVGEPLREWEPGRWWRVEGPDPDCAKCHGDPEYTHTPRAYSEEIGTYPCGCRSLLCETSDEDEARASMRPGDTLYRIYEYRDKQCREVKTQ